MQSLVAFPPIPPEEEAMPLREEQKQFIRDEIAEQLKKVVELFRPHGWNKAVFVLRQLGPLAAVIALFLAITAIAVGAIYQATARVEKETRFQTNTERTLTEIKNEIVDIKGQLTKQSLVNHAALPLPDFQATLPDLGSSIAAAKQQNLKIPSRVMDDLSTKLASTAQEAPAYWPVAAATINYRSFLLVGNLQNWSKQFPPCPGTVDLLGADKNAVVQATTPEGKPKGSKIPIVRIGNQDCYVELDGKKVSKWDCVRCLVKYSGGPLSLTDVHFTDCLFVFNLQAKPAVPAGQKLVQSVLASNALKVDIPRA